MAKAPHPAAKVAPQEVAGPNEMRDPAMRAEFRRASVWIGLVVAVVAVWYLAEPILLIFGGVVIAAMFDGGARLLGRVAPWPRGIRLAVVIVGVVLFMVWTMFYAGSQLASQAESLRAIITAQASRLTGLAQNAGLISADSASSLGQQVLGSVGRVTSFVGSALGTITSAVMMLVLAVFLAINPKSYERGVAWLFPLGSRERLYDTFSDMGHSLRMLMAGRLLGMLVEGVGTWVLLALGGVPMAALLGL